MNIEIKKLSLKNFKGIKKLDIDFGKSTNILGDNGTGKTTIFDSFTWLLFDKDSLDRKNFNIKTLDDNNNEIHNVEHLVEAHLLLDGEPLELKKIYKEKWTKKRGEQNQELTGHTTNYFIDNVPVKKAEYEKKINEIIDENIFKLVTNPLYFANRHWEEKRKILIEIAGNIKNIDIINSNKQLEKISKILEDKETEDIKKSITQQKRLIKKEIETIPVRIDEIQNSISPINFKEEKNKIKIINGKIKEIEKEILKESSKDEKTNKIKEKIYEAKNKILEEENKIRKNNQKVLSYLMDLEEKERQKKQEIFSLKNQEKVKNARLKEIQEEIKHSEEEINNIKSFQKELKEELDKLEQEMFQMDETSFICPTCHQDLPKDKKEEKIKELKVNFEKNRNREKEIILKKAFLYKEKITKAKDFIKQLKEEQSSKLNEKVNFDELDLELSQLQKERENYKEKHFIENLENDEIKKLNDKIKTLEEKLKQEKDFNLDNLKEQKEKLQEEKESIQKILVLENINKQKQERIIELTKEKSKFEKSFEELQETEFLVEEFVFTKVNLLEEKINSKFKNIKFKLFEKQINGGINEICTPLINGVPYESANNAGKIQAGIEIINVLSDYYNVYAPIFIDNRESVNEIPFSNSQIINLIVSKDKQLKINTTDNLEDFNLESEINLNELFGDDEDEN